MESLAYVHLSLAYEAADNIQSVSVSSNLRLFQGLNWKKLSSCAWIYWLSLAVALSILGVAGQASAALQEGDRSPEVITLQQRLQRLGYFNARTTGYFGSLTKEAVIQFQTAKKLNPDGVVGPQTLAALGEIKKSTPRTNTITRVRTNTTATSTKTRTPQQPVSQPSNNFLTLGSSGQAVQALQETLKGIGLYRGSVNGVFGSETEAAVKQFQQANRLTADGIVGPRTRAALPVVGGSSADSLQLGDQSKDVADLQRRLRQLAYFRGRMTGYFDAETQQALIQFQREQRLPADGVAGQKTLLVLQKISDRAGIVALQKRLKEKGFYRGSLDGNFGPQTKAAIAEAQKAYDVSADDIVNGRF